MIVIYVNMEPHKTIPNLLVKYIYARDTVRIGKHGKSSIINLKLKSNVLSSAWIEQRPSKPQVIGSNPIERKIFIICL